jgi:hypothetical protein
LLAPILAGIFDFYAFALLLSALVNGCEIRARFARKQPVVDNPKIVRSIRQVL